MIKELKATASVTLSVFNAGLGWEWTAKTSNGGYLGESEDSYDTQEEALENMFSRFGAVDFE